MLTVAGLVAIVVTPLAVIAATIAIGSQVIAAIDWLGRRPWYIRWEIRRLRRRGLARMWVVK